MTTQPTSQPGADQPLVTHEDLGVLQHLRIATGPDFEEEDDERVSALLDRLIQAAEADKPALPEGWVLIDGLPRWHDGKGGLAFKAHGAVHLRIEELDRDRLTPLVTAASLVPEGWCVEVGEKPDHDGLDVILDADRSAVMFRCDAEATFERDDIFAVLAALVTAAQAERGESR